MGRAVSSHTYIGPGSLEPTTQRLSCLSEGYGWRIVLLPPFCLVGAVEEVVRLGHVPLASRRVLRARVEVAVHHCL